MLVCLSVMVLRLKYGEGYVHVLEQSLKCISQSSSFSNVYGYSNSLFFKLDFSGFVFDICDGVIAVFQHWWMFICRIKFGGVVAN